MGLIQQIVTLAEKKEQKPLQDANGFWYYPEQPEGTRLATLEDIAKGNFKKGAPLLCHGFHSNRFECYRSKGEVSDELREFIIQERVYLFTEQ